MANSDNKINKASVGEESIENGKQEKNNSLKQQFIKEFIINGSKKGKNKTEFLNSIFKGDNNKIPESIFQDMEHLNLLYKVQGNPINLEDISLSDLKKESLNKYGVLLNKRSNFKKFLISDYNISPDDYNKTFSSKVDDLEEGELDDLLELELKRLDFANSVSKKRIERKNFLGFLDKFDIKSRYKNLDEEKKKIFLEFYDVNSDGSFILKEYINISDISSLFESGIFSNGELREIISKFAVTLDLQKAKALKIISEENIRKIKLGLIEKEILENLSDEEKNELINRIKSEDIQIDFSHDFINKEKINFDEILEVVSFTSIIKSYNDSMKKIVEYGDRVQNFEGELLKRKINNFKKGNILTMVLAKPQDKSDTSEKLITYYYEIVDLGDLDGKVKLLEKSYNNRYSKTKTKECSFSQKNIISILENGGFSKIEGIKDEDKALELRKFECYDKEEIEDSVKDPENKDFLENSEELSLFTPEEILKKKELLDGNDENYKDKLLEIEKLNVDILKGKIDELDTAGKKFGLEKGVTFETKKNDKGQKGYFTISHINNDGFIGLENVYGISQGEISFEEFFQGWVLEKPKRVSKASSMEDVFAGVSSYGDFGDKWGDFEFKDNGIYKKEGSEKQKFEYDYLTSTKGGQLIKIHSISGDKVIISFGEYKQKLKDEKDKKDGEKKTNTIFKVEESTQSVSIGFLDSWIREHEMIPRSLEEEKDVKETDIESINMHGSFVSRLFDRLSIAQLLAGGKLYIDAIENYLKEGQDELSARFANSLWLPEELKADLVSREESAKKKRMDDYIQKLKDVDSGPATKMIEGWLLNKDAPQYQKEAGLMFMIEKYGVLYAKYGLYGYKGQFLWYQSLGGKIGDPLFEEVKADAESRDQTFTEEELIHKLLMKQCRGSGFNGIKRMSRLHKTFKSFRASGKEQEMKDGKQDGGDMSRCSDIVDFAMWELKGGTYANAIGGLEVVVDRGGSMEEMNKIPFIILFSGVGYGMEEVSRKVLMEMPYTGKLLPLLSLIGSSSGVDLATDTILELSKKIEERGNDKYKGMGDAAQKIFNNMKSTSISEGDKIDACEKFYDKYDKVLTQGLFGLNDGKDSINGGVDSHITNMIFLEKDEHNNDAGEVKSGNATFKKYYDTMSANKSDFKYDETYMSDAFIKKGLSGLDSYKAMKFALKVNSGGSYINAKGGPSIIKEIIQQIKVLSETKDLNDIDKKKLVIKNLQGIIGAFIELSIDSFSRSRQLDSFLNKLGINLEEVKDLGLEKSKIDAFKEGTKEYEYLNKIVAKIMKGEASETSNESDNIDLSDILSGTKDKTSNLL